MSLCCTRASGSSANTAAFTCETRHEPRTKLFSYLLFPSGQHAATKVRKEARAHSGGATNKRRCRSS